jgi:hypothetical protein
MTKANATHLFLQWENPPHSPERAAAPTNPTAGSAARSALARVVTIVALPQPRDEATEVRG